MSKQNSNVREKILNFLLWQPNEQWYEKEIAQKTGVSKSAVNLVIKQLVKDKWLDLTEKGRLNLYQANIDSAKVRSYKKNLTINKLDKLSSHLKDKAEKVILFGSASMGEDSMISDLDLMIVSNQKLETKKIRKLMPVDRQGQVIIKSTAEFTDLRDKNKAFYQAIIRGENLI